MLQKLLKHNLHQFMKSFFDMDFILFVGCVIMSGRQDTAKIKHLPTQLNVSSMLSPPVLTRTVHSFVVVGIDAHILLLGAERVLAALQGLQLVVGLEVRPAPHSAVNDVRQAFPVRHLQPSIQGAGDRHAVAGLARAAESPLQLLHGPLLLFQLFHQSVHSFLGPLLLLVSLLPSQQPLHRRAGEGEQRGDVHAGQAALLPSPLGPKEV